MTDPRVQVLPIPQDLHWEIQKYLRHPTAELLASNWEDVFKGMLEKQRLFLCFEPWSAWQQPESFDCITWVCRPKDPKGNEYMNRWREHLDNKHDDRYPPEIRGDRIQMMLRDLFRR